MKASNMKPTSVCSLLVLAVLALTLSTSAHEAPGAVKSNAVTRVKRSGKANYVFRQRRQAPTLTKNQKKELLGHHNLLRGMEGADNMETMVRPWI